MSIHHCEMPGAACRKPFTKVAIFNNALGQEMRLPLCAEHVVAFSDPAVRTDLFKKAMASWSTLSNRSPLEMLAHPTQQALMAHQEACQQCADVRDWVAGEVRKGLDADAILHIGLYVATHACPEGVKLNEEVGRAMKSV